MTTIQKRAQNALLAKRILARIDLRLRQIMSDRSPLDREQARAFVLQFWFI